MYGNKRPPHNKDNLTKSGKDKHSEGSHETEKVQTTEMPQPEQEAVIKKTKRSISKIVL